MSRIIGGALATHLASGGKTICYLMKLRPRVGAAFGITTLNRNVVYADGSPDGDSNGDITYYAATGYTAFDLDTKSDLSVDNSMANALLGQYPLKGVTAEGVRRGDYDGARFVQYLVNYKDLSMGHVILSFGRIGQIKMVDELACSIELRSLTQVLKQQSMIEQTSITCRAQFGDDRCKMGFIWHSGTVDTVGAEPDRTFAVAIDSSGGLPALNPDGSYAPSVVQWLTGANAGHENETESYDPGYGLLTLAIPTYADIQAGDTFRIRGDCDYSKAMCKLYGNLLNMRAEADMNRADGTALQSPDPVQQDGTS